MRCTILKSSAMAVFSLLLGLVPQAQVPAPVFEGVTVQATVTEDQASGQYTYDYLVTNPSTNTLRLWIFDVVVSGAEETTTVAASAGWVKGDINLTPPNSNFVPDKPYVTWGTWSGMSGMPVPGTTSGPFGLQSRNPPSIREAWVTPRVLAYIQALIAEQGEVSFDEQDEINVRYIRKVNTLGPLGVPPGSFQHWDAYIADVGTAVSLGWLSDPALAAAIRSNLWAARQAALAEDQATVYAKLQAVIDAIQASTPSQRTSEGYALVLFNAKYLQWSIPWPCEPKLTLSPPTSSHTLGETASLSALLVNVANGNPIADNELTFQVTEGPHAGLSSVVRTDAAGKAVFTYQGVREGTDTILVHAPYGTIRRDGKTSGAKPPAQGSKGRAGAAASRQAVAWCQAYDTQSEPVHVTWEGGPDLRVPVFIPPVLLSAPGRTFYISDTTMNTGNLPAEPSVTRYYISAQEPVDPATATVVGERAVPALAPGESSAVLRVPYTVPATLPAGTYYLDACADADGKIAETHEENNCASSQLMVAVAAAPALDCSKAAASPALLWPTDHKLVPIAISGVTDPDGDSVTLTITGITQDEPLNGLGDGDICPDGFGAGASQAQVRAERSETGNGRVYAISFTASDGKGGTCQGRVGVGVPHDRKDTPVDDGQKFDSTKCP
jgi:hypothetical protein